MMPCPEVEARGEGCVREVMEDANPPGFVQDGEGPAEGIDELAAVEWGGVLEERRVVAEDARHIPLELATAASSATNGASSTPGIPPNGPLLDLRVSHRRHGLCPGISHPRRPCWAALMGL